MRLKFTGKNASGFTAVGGFTFPMGEAVEVDDEDTIRRLRSHPEFEVVKGRKPKADDED